MKTIIILSLLVGLPIAASFFIIWRSWRSISQCPRCGRFFDADGRPHDRASGDGPVNDFCSTRVCADCGEGEK